jgi:hypothetical protein
VRCRACKKSVCASLQQLVLLAGVVCWQRYYAFLFSLTVALTFNVGQLQAQQPGAI